jgi:hypothetical protein
MPAKPKPKELSRQRRYQLEREAKGLCRICGRKAVKGKKLCAPHREDSNRRSLLYARRMAGIPDNAPLLRGDRRTKTKTGDPVV